MLPSRSALFSLTLRSLAHPRVMASRAARIDLARDLAANNKKAHTDCAALLRRRQGRMLDVSGTARHR
jgi:hypothetical protein